MTDVITYQRFWMRRDTAANWTSANPVLASGEWGVETDNTGATPRKYKMGDGITAWASLAYADGSALVIDSIADADTTHAPSRNAVFDALAAEVAARDAAIAAAVAGLSWKQAVRAATTVAGTLATNFENGDTVDGVVLATGDRILVKNQAAPSENGIYTVNVSGAPTRASDANSGAELVNASCYVSEGTANADKQFTCTTDAPITLGATGLTWVQSGSGSTYTADGTTLDLVGTVFGVKAGGIGTAQLAADAVTYAKLQNVSAQLRILLRKTAGAGDVEEGTLSELLDFIGSAAQGDILYRDASGWARLAAGTSGNLMSTQGAGANPQWITPGAASVGAGAQVGYARTLSSTPATTISAIPLDNSIPQVGEGAAYASLSTAITPSASSSLLEVTLTIPVVSASATANIAVAIFRDGAANAIGANFVAIEAADRSRPICVVAVVAAGSTAPTTFDVRWGTSTGTGALLRTNATAAFLGGVLQASMVVREIKQ